MFCGWVFGFLLRWLMSDDWWPMCEGVQLIHLNIHDEEKHL